MISCFYYGESPLVHVQMDSPEFVVLHGRFPTSHFIGHGILIHSGCLEAKAVGHCYIFFMGHSCFTSSLPFFALSGSGKTYTMKPLPIKASRDILRLMHHTYRNQGFQLFVSFFEIYGGKLFDLLNDRK